MFQELAARITTAQRKQLRVAGVPDSRVTEWKHGRSKPTYSQLLALSHVMGWNFCELAYSIAKETAPPETLDFFNRIEGQQGPQMKLGDDF